MVGDLDPYDAPEGFVPPDPVLKFYAERRINAIERDEAGER